MSFGAMNKIADIIKVHHYVDDDGFNQTAEEKVATVRVYREAQHASKYWANLAQFSKATNVFRMRIVPGLKITDDMLIYCDGQKFKIESIEDVSGKGMYLEIKAEEVEAIG